jgi:hypothetical protein
MEGMMGHSDEGQDVQLIRQVLAESIEPLVSVVQNILDKLAGMDDELDALGKVVNEEIIGGITNLYKSKERLSGISELSSKYGEVMGPYKDFYSEMTDGSDIFEKLYDELEDFKASGDTDDAAIDAKVRELSEMLKAKYEKIKGMGVEEKPTEEAPAAAIEIEIEKPTDGIEGVLEKVRGMKSKASGRKDLGM